MSEFKTISQKRDISKRLSALQDELTPLASKKTGSNVAVLDFINRKLSNGNLSLEEVNALKSVAESSSETEEKLSRLPGENDPNPVGITRMRTSGGLSESESGVGFNEKVAPAFRKSFDDTFVKDAERIALRREEKKSKEDAFKDKAKTLINIRNLATEEGQDLIAGKEQLNLREAVAKDMAKERIMMKALDSNQYDVFKKSIPVTRNAEGEVTIKMTPAVSKLFETPKGKEALLKAQRDFISEEQAGASVRDQLEEEISKAEKETKSSGAGSGTFLDMFTRAMAPKTPQKKNVDVPETGESLNVGAQPAQVPIFASEEEAEASGYKGRAVIGTRLAEIS